MSLPQWLGASVVYTRSMKILEWMGQNGYVEVVRNRRGRAIRSIPSQEVLDFVAALDTGNEETIKGHVQKFAVYHPTVFSDILKETRA